MKYEAVIGLEVHLHLNTRTKAFCGCSTEFGKEPNTQVCPVCLGFPGSLPVYNQAALDYAIKVALALNCRVQEYTKFDRKNYFYPDLPKNYQVSQYDLPLSVHGFLDIELNGQLKRIGITRVHMEEDAGKLIHQENASLVDFNRTGIPLLEIVSEPDINSPEEAYEYLAMLKSTIQYLDVSDCDMEKGSLRCDANISLRPAGTKILGVKTELKNMNSFKGVKDALSYEIRRQAEMLDSGEKLRQDTRLWDAKAQETIAMRTKEGAKDYRYFPEPDLPPFIIKEDKIAEIKKTIPELPKEKMQRFIKDYGLTEYVAKILVASKQGALFAEECLKKTTDKNIKSVANWIIGPLSALTSSTCAIHELNISADNLAGLVDLVENEKIISNLTGKIVLEEMCKTGKTAKAIVEEKNLAQISDSQSLNSIIEEAIKENPKSVADFKAGKANALMFLVGQVMRKSSGKANPKVVQELIRKRLANA
ncbi:MAG: Asp-tRNA(Asn)/Glu-tRNA(Gln) amidotransferase subunit GatB [Candidatus Omnitrophica bacterium]|nr:Asp-tRNA(Asn)/Glu-tRNA(Gln) amidotransferase subunit GatB [Candidatus Omnitrophota bacterium]MDD5027046.1 Asp-tRNA(Asn)/Glu-tRNA(Gln) amidotransferase subunit GatB [Candidatus Omnitrophota bacterium]MDD5661848.1 Asp-tRNA(Asn)/Glu-tRNA(Gln) amidotransferase subunit GatB [Candidatus Omnitrophota bacterium]